MKKYVNPIPDGGAPLHNNRINTQLQIEIWEAMEGVLSRFNLGANGQYGVIVSGCVITDNAGNFDMTAGIVYLNGEFMRIPAAVNQAFTKYIAAAAITYEQKVFGDGTPKNLIEVKAAELVGAAPGAGHYITISSLTSANARRLSVLNPAAPFVSADITDGAIITAKIPDGNITTAKILDSNVTTNKIADSNVTTNKIADGNITTNKIADNNVTTGKVADGAITHPKLEGGFDVSGDTGSGGAATTIATLTPTDNKLFLIEVTMETKFVSGSSGSDIGSSHKAAAFYKKTAGAISLVDTKKTIFTIVGGANPPSSIILTISGGNILIQAQAASGEVYNCRVHGAIKYI